MSTVFELLFIYLFPYHHDVCQSLHMVHGQTGVCSLACVACSITLLQGNNDICVVKTNCSSCHIMLYSLSRKPKIGNSVYHKAKLGLCESARQ